MNPRPIVRTPEGVEWRLERRLVRPSFRRPRWPGRGELDEFTLRLIGPPPFDGDLLSGLAIFVAAIAVVLIVVPLLVFGIELVLFALVASAALLGSVIVTPHWRICATNAHTGDVYEREIAGSRASAAALAQLAELISAGHEPEPRRSWAGRRESVPPAV
jgi:hypothetical protein